MVSILALVIIGQQVAKPDALVGRKAPEISGLSWTNSPAFEPTPENLRGKVVFLVFSSYGCYQCNTPMHVASKRFAEKSKDGFVGLVSMIDATEAQRDQKTKDRQLKCPVAIDDGRKLFERFGCTVAPTSILIDRKGIVRSVEYGVANVKQFDILVNKLLAETP